MLLSNLCPEIRGHIQAPGGMENRQRHAGCRHNSLNTNGLLDCRRGRDMPTPLLGLLLDRRFAQNGRACVHRARQKVRERPISLQHY